MSLPDVVEPTTAPELTPGGMLVRKSRTLASGHVVEFEAAPAGWLAKNGDPRKQDWRAYHLHEPDAKVTDKARRVPSVTTILDGILPKPGLPPWAERAGIAGAVEAFRHGLIGPATTDEEAVQIVRSNRLGADAARDSAADRGLNVHALLEAYMATGSAPNPRDHPDLHRPFIRGLVRWLLATNPEPVAVELLVADPDRNYAGRLDLIARIDGQFTLVDLKTQERGGIYESAHVQVRLYRQAEERFGEHEFEDARVVVVDGYGGFDEMPLLASDDLADRALDFYLPTKQLAAACNSRNRAVRTALESTTTPES
jgi:hypothetical protein